MHPKPAARSIGSGISGGTIKSATGNPNALDGHALPRGWSGSGFSLLRGHDCPAVAWSLAQPWPPQKPANPVVHGPAQCLSHRIEVGRVLKHRFSKSSAIKIQSGVAQCQSMRYRKTGDSERFRLMSIRFSRFDVAARNGSKEICRVVVKDNFSAGSARGFNSPASQLTASVFSGSNDIETCSVRPQVEHSNVRTSKPLGRDRCSPKPTGACTPHTSAARLSI
jgi:hypothetical protein